MAAPASTAAPSGTGPTSTPPESSGAAVGADPTLALQALKAMDFESVVHRNDVWQDAPYDVPDLHAALRAEFEEALEALVQSTSGRSPLGWFITGSGGRGKTHLLGAFRRIAIERKAAFVLVDLTDVRNFWDTVLQGMVSSLQQPYESGRFQYQTLLQNAVSRFRHPLPPRTIVDYLRGRKTTKLARDIQQILASFAKHPGARIPPLRHRDVIRSLVCLNSLDPGVSGVGLSWLQGLELGERERVSLDFQASSAPPREIAEALSWLMGFAGPTVLAFDQLDPIVTQAERGAAGLADAAGVTTGIVRDIGDGLGSIFQLFGRTLPVVVCVEQTLETLRRHALTTALDRFNEPQPLPAISDGRIAAAVVRRRTAPAFEKSGFAPPYDTWPFAPGLFEATANLTPREVLKICQAHRLKCLRAKRPEELTSLGQQVEPAPIAASPTPSLDAKFAAYQREADPKTLLEEKEEDQRIAPLLQTALHCLVQEADLPAEVSAVLDADFTGGKKTKPLHARLRLVFHAEDEREEHFSVRAVQHLHPRAYLVRLKDAMTAAGIDEHLRFRRLAVVRTHPHPSGEECTKLRQSFVQQGGIFYDLPEAELRTLYALQKLREENDTGFLDWLRVRRPAGGMALLRTLAPHSLLGTAEPAATPVEPPAPPAAAKKPAATQAPQAPPETEIHPPPALPPVAAASAAEVKIDPPPPFPSARPRHVRTGFIPFGRKAAGALAQGEWRLPVGGLALHTAVLAGSGSGKSVLLRRIVEEAALEGIPSLVVDGGRELSTLGEAWPPHLALHGADDALKADAYLRSSDVVVWTPGNQDGNPLPLPLLPELSAAADDPEELGDLVEATVESLLPIVAPRGGRTADHKQVVLDKVLRCWARRGGGSFEALQAILRSLPDEAKSGVEREARYARESADALLAAREADPLLFDPGPPFDPARLFGDGPAAPGGRTRVSVLSLAALPEVEARPRFVHRLAAALFAWLQRNPLRAPRPLRGLLVIDEARELVDGRQGRPSGERLVRLLKQAAKHELGVVLATQNPQDLGGRVLSSCATHLVGKLNSAAAIGAAKDLLRQQGGTGDDLPRLPRGVFYAHHAAAPASPPTKIQSLLCLSHHRAVPPSPEEIVAKAAECRRKSTGV